MVDVSSLEKWYVVLCSARTNCMRPDDAILDRKGSIPPQLEVIKLQLLHSYHWQLASRTTFHLARKQSGQSRQTKLGTHWKSPGLGNPLIKKNPNLLGLASRAGRILEGRDSSSTSRNLVERRLPGRDKFFSLIARRSLVSSHQDQPYPNVGEKNIAQPPIFVNIPLFTLPLVHDGSRADHTIRPASWYAQWLVQYRDLH